MRNLLAPQTYVCDHCGKLHTEKRFVLEINLGDVVNSGGFISGFSNKTYHFCNKNNKCIEKWIGVLNQKEIR